MSQSNGTAAVMERPIVQVMIRLATEADLPACVDSIVAMRADTIWEHIDFEPDRVHILKTLMADLSTPLHRLVVAEIDGQIIGICGGALTTAKFIPDVLVVQEWAWWVTPEYRHVTPSIGWRMWMDLTAWAREQGAIAGIYGKARKLHDLRVSTPFETMIWFPLRRQEAS